MAKRRKFSPKEKLDVVRRHLLESVPVSDLCDEHDLNPNVFYRWQKRLFEQGTAAFQRTADARERALEKKVHSLQSKLAKKDEVIAETMESHVRLKKVLGKPDRALGAPFCAR